MIKEELLLKINKPARYIGREYNSVYKDFDSCKVKFALCFPDLYEVGMSNLGIRIIYGLLNSLSDVVCERFFVPDEDLENLLRAGRIDIVSLESQKSLREFDFVGFSLGYELEYTNVLNLLDLGRIPLSYYYRDHTYPLVIGGGPCILNPEPLWEFFDLFVLGEAEEVLIEIIELYKAYQEDFKKGKLKKEELLIKFAQIKGIYVSSLYEVSYDQQGKIKDFRPKYNKIPSIIEKRTVINLDKSYFPTHWIVPYISIVHDRPSIEIMRGCPNKCRFCQARIHYFPFRIRDLNKILELVKDVYFSTGYEEIAFCGLSVSDYPNFNFLIKKTFDLLREYKVSISLPSLKPKAYLEETTFLISQIKKTTLTFAPEAGEERLRNLLGKNFDLENFNKAVKFAYSFGYRHIKLYFMIGIPTEEEKDIDTILDFSSGLIQADKNPNFARINISITTLIPKPHTSFQWLGMEKLEKIFLKYQYLKEKAYKIKKINLDLHNPYMSTLEAVLCRGDRRLSKVILSAFKKGAKFDAWGNKFNFKLWQESFKEQRVDFEFYLEPKKREEKLPWDFLDVGVDKTKIHQDYKNLFCL